MTHYLRVSANVSDKFYLDEAKTVAFTASQTESEVVSFVDDPNNASVVFDMMDLNTYESLRGESIQANVAGFVTKDSTGYPITGRSYYTYVVTKNRGGYPKIQASST